MQKTQPLPAEESCINQKETTTMSIYPAQVTDLDTLIQLFRQCSRSMLAAGIAQWDDHYPIPQQVEEDIANQSVFAWKKDDLILGTITLNGQQDEQYQDITWQLPAERVLVIHRLAVAPAGQGQGIGKALCRFAETYAADHDYTVIRLDAYSGNLVSNRLYEKLGYQKAKGLCWFHGNDLPFWCWEKAID